MNYYLKEILSTRLYTTDGAVVNARFTEVGKDVGVIATEDGWLISELNKCLARRVGGLRIITADEYQEWLKKKVEKTSPRRFLSAAAFHQSMAFRPPVAPPARPAGAAAKAAEPPAPPPPIEVPKVFEKPKVGRPRVRPL